MILLFVGSLRQYLRIWLPRRYITVIRHWRKTSSAPPSQLKRKWSAIQVPRVPIPFATCRDVAPAAMVCTQPRPRIGKATQIRYHTYGTNWLSINRNDSVSVAWWEPWAVVSLDWAATMDCRRWCRGWTNRWVTLRLGKSTLSNWRRQCTM